MINQFTIEPPLATEAGDELRRAGLTIEQWRNGSLIRTATLIPVGRLEEIEVFGNRTIETVYLEAAMPGQNVSMTQVRENQTSGVILVDFSSGTQLEFPSWDAVGEVASSIDSLPDLAEKILLGKAYRASPDGTNKTTQIGASVSANLLASEPIVYTGPQ